MVVLTIALFPSVAMAGRIVPPGNSAANQYTETFPTTGGGSSTKNTDSRSPTKILGARNTRRLKALGPEGRAVAALAAATAPSGLKNRRGTSVAAGDARGSEGSGNSEASGSSGWREVIKQATGVSTSGQMGFLLPLVVVAATMWSFTYLWRRKRRPS